MKIVAKHCLHCISRELPFSWHWKPHHCRIKASVDKEAYEKDAIKKLLRLVIMQRNVEIMIGMLIIAALIAKKFSG